MHIINLIDDFGSVNFGVWNAALSTAQILNQKYSYTSHAWFPKIEEIPAIDSVNMKVFEKINYGELQKALEEGGFTPDNCIVVSHGCWRFPSKWGNKLKEYGFKWVAIPHGMLEPWSMQQKKIKKSIYYRLFERKLLSSADIIRAVGTPEYNNLKRDFNKNVRLISNGIEPVLINDVVKKKSVKSFLFIARLHHKKGVIPMVKAWLDSPLANDSDYCLNIAGPDDGELPALQVLLANSKVSNIKYLGPVYGEEKEKLFQNNHFFLQPSFSEGFSTSVLEAMQYGLIPIITEGCNFPEALENNLAIKVKTEKNSIKKGLILASKIPDNEMITWGERASEFVTENYSLQHIAKLQAELYQKLLNS
ncbi:MAG: glycosyltransferase [Fibrobacter sp.]|nr:glycosyltransferase [Fibrobacter sp.]